MNLTVITDRVVRTASGTLSDYTSRVIAVDLVLGEIKQEMIAAGHKVKGRGNYDVLIVDGKELSISRALKEDDKIVATVEQNGRLETFGGDKR